ncbi:MAG: hypothetical protein WB676_17565, partial [Bryobacteraceae bacterium]
PTPQEREAGFETAWKDIQSLQIEGRPATLWLYKPNATFAATLDVPETSLGCGSWRQTFPAASVLPRQEYAKSTPDEAIENLRERIKSPWSEL